MYAINNVDVGVSGTTSGTTSVVQHYEYVNPSISGTIKLSLLGAGLKHYHDRNNGIYPKTLSELVPEDLNKIPPNIDGRPYTYHTFENRRSYQFCYIMSNNYETCFGEDANGNFTSSRAPRK